tara:strand:- start:18 stop:560 length:543 start_codon:yes stop_codon:yes gene_type:complete
MSGKGLSNNPKVRLKVANRAKTHMEYFQSKGESMTRSRVQVQPPYNSKYDYERVYHKRAANIEKSYNTGKPVKSQTNPSKLDKSLSGNTNRQSYAKSISQLNKFNKEVANFGNKMERLQPAFQKDIMTKKLKNYKTMGKVIKGAKTITPAGLVTAIMQPKKVGDATLKNMNRNRNPNFPR